ncbi:S26 family signal peptidase [Nonomuraea wenchangensis]
MTGAVAGVVVVLAVGVLLLRRRFLLVTVRGRSMQPTLSDGNRLLMARRAGHRASRDDIVAVRIPAGSGRNAGLYIKRVAAIAGDRLPSGIPSTSGDDLVPDGKLALLGDWPFSLDSREWGCVPSEWVLGIAVRKFPIPVQKRG